MSAECSRAAVISPYSYRRPKMYFAFIGRGLNDRGDRSSRFPISKFALGRRDRQPIVFSYRGFIYFFKAAECALYRSETLGSYEIRM